MTYLFSCCILSQLMLTSKQPVEKVFLLLRIKISFSQVFSKISVGDLSQANIFTSQTKI